MCKGKCVFGWWKAEACWLGKVKGAFEERNVQSVMLGKVKGDLDLGELCELDWNILRV